MNTEILQSISVKWKETLCQNLGFIYIKPSWSLNVYCNVIRSGGMCWCHHRTLGPGTPFLSVSAGHVWRSQLLPDKKDNGAPRRPIQSDSTTRLVCDGFPRRRHFLTDSTGENAARADISWTQSASIRAECCYAVNPSRRGMTGTWPWASSRARGGYSLVHGASLRAGRAN